jgi:diguanylate cyclase (GGDEF)-like protein
MKQIKRNIVIIMLLCTILSSLLIGILSVETSKRIVNENAVQRLSLLGDSSQKDLNTALDNIRQSTNILASYALERLSDPVKFQSDPSYVQSYSDMIEPSLRTAALNTSGAVTVYIRYNPELTTPTSGVVLMKDSTYGYFAAITPTDLSQYDAGDERVAWYYRPVSSQSPEWIMPYRNDVSNGKYILSYVVPLVRKGVCYGVVGMDMDYSTLKQTVDAIQIYDTGYAFLVDGSENMLVHRNFGIYTPVKSIENGQLSGLFTAAHAGSNDLSYVFRGEKRNCAIRQLNNGMILVLSAPVAEIFRDSSKLSYQIILVTVISLIIVTVIAMVVITQMLKPATTDALTGVNNRQSFLSQVKDRLSEHRQIPYAFIMIDIDHFKQINDTRGHAAGDNAIRQIAAHLNRVFSADDLIGRYGGDEFLIFMQCESKAIISRRMDQLGRCLAQGGPLFSDSLTCSAGIVYTKDYTLSTDELMTRADKTLYQAKKSGRNRFLFYGDPDPDDKPEEKTAA